jgi:hypothetical protein
MAAEADEMEQQPDKHTARNATIAAAVIGAAGAIIAALIAAPGSDGPTPEPDGPRPPGMSTVTPSPIDSVRPQPPPPAPSVPAEIIGSWSGQGRQYATDPFPQDLDVVFTGDGRYSKVTEGVARDEGRFEVHGTSLVFRAAGSSASTWQWDIKQSAGSPILILANGIRTYELERVG